MSQGYGIFKGQTNLGNVVGVSPDKKYAFMPAYENAAKLNLYRVDLQKKRQPKTYQRGTSDTVDYFVNSNGNVVARERYHNEQNLHRVESRIKDEWVEIYRQKTNIPIKSFSGLTPDNKSLVFRKTNNKTGRKAYYTMSLIDGKISDAIFSKKDKDVEYLLKDINRIVYGVKYSGFTPSYEFFNKNLNAIMKGINKAMPNNAFTIQGLYP